jgi:hypothetical protein
MMQAELARQMPALGKSKLRKGKTLASKTKGQRSSSKAVVPATPSSDLTPSPAPATDPRRDAPAAAGNDGPELETLTGEPGSLSGRKRAAPEIGSGRSKKGKAALTSSDDVWCPAWILQTESSALGDEKLSS